MTAPAAPPASPLLPDASRCPDCRAPLAVPGSGRATACPRCGLPLTNRWALRLWDVDTELLRLHARREALLVERTGLLTALRSLGTGDLAPLPEDGVPTQAPHPAGPVPPPSTVPQPRAEWTPKRVQNLLLGLGGLLLAIAALVFTAVTYDRLGAGGRATVLVVLTLLAATAAPTVLARGLSATAETAGAVALVLAGLDAYGLRTLGLGTDADPVTYTAVSAGVLAVAALVYARFVPLRTARRAGVVLSQLAVLLLVVSWGPEQGAAAVVLAVLAAADLAVLAALRGRSLPNDVRTTLAVCAGIVTVLGVLLAVDAAGGRSAVSGAFALLALAAVMVAAALLVHDPVLRAALTSAPVLLLAVAAWGLTQREISTTSEPLVPAAAGLVAALVATRLPRAWRTGPALGAALAAAASLAWVAEQVVTGVLLPVTWLVDPWSRSAVGARGVLGPEATWEGTLVTTLVLAVAALTTFTCGLALRRLRVAVGPAGALAAATAVLLPLGLDTSFPVALGLLLSVAVALEVAGLALQTRHRAAGPALVGAGTAVVLLTCCWATADRTATLVVLPLATVLLAGLGAGRRLPAPAVLPVTALAGGLGSAALGAVGAAGDLTADQVGGLLLISAAALACVAALLSRTGDRTGSDGRTGAELAGLVTACAAASLAVPDPGWLSWVLAAAGLIGLATALLPDRRRAAVAAGLLLSASSWVRLADAGVTAPEPYVLPLAAFALALGHLRRRADPSTPSFAAYGAGLSVLLLPSLLASFDDESPARALLLGLAALVVLLAGARHRLQAPLAIGAGV
ncbi:MAG: hypothetical protein JWN88_2572, partial [Frankiales bacterium]|nr:hypothetical protein [Frankiales bacterium]